MKKNNFLVSCIVFFFILVGLCLLRLSVQFGLFDVFGQTGVGTAFSIGAQIILMFGLPVIVFSIYNRKKKPHSEVIMENNVVVIDAVQEKKVGAFKKTFNFLGFRKISSKVIGLSILAGLTMFLFNIFFSTFINSILTAIGYKFPTYADDNLTGIVGLIYGLFFSAVLPGVCEETTHRGMLLNGLKEKFGLKKALIISAVMFGLMHLNIAQFFFATVLGFIMGLTCALAKSIWPGIIMHFINNGLITYIGSASDNNWFLGNFFSVIGNFLNGLPLGLVFVVLLTVLLGRLLFGIIKTIFKTNGAEVNLAAELLISKPKEKLTVIEGVFYYGGLFLGCLMTLFTFLWGLF